LRAREFLQHHQRRVALRRPTSGIEGQFHDNTSGLAPNDLLSGSSRSTSFSLGVFHVFKVEGSLRRRRSQRRQENGLVDWPALRESVPREKF
jgi:hypothetical protein